VTRPAARRRVAALLAGLLGWCASRSAVGQEVVRVDVVRPDGADATMMEVATRAWAELSADGVPATLVDAGGAVPSDEKALALTVVTYRRLGEAVTDLELASGGRPPGTIRRTVVIGPDTADPKLLAIRAVEVVHGVLLEARAAVARRTAPVVISAVDEESPDDPAPWRPPPPPPRWAAGTGLALLGGLGGLGTAFGGLLRAGYYPPRGLGASLLAGAAAFGGALATTRGELSMHQELAAAELCYRFFAAHSVRPQIDVGVGAYHVGATFSAASPQPSTSDSFWAAAVIGGAGVAAGIADHLELFVDTRLMIAYPHPEAPLGGGAMATGADPSLLVSLGVQRTF
jgi:hypothetical protein